MAVLRARYAEMIELYARKVEEFKIPSSRHDGSMAGICITRVQAPKAINEDLREGGHGRRMLIAA